MKELYIKLSSSSISFYSKKLTQQAFLHPLVMFNKTLFCYDTQIYISLYSKWIFMNALCWTMFGKCNGSHHFPVNDSLMDVLHEMWTTDLNTFSKRGYKMQNFLRGVLCDSKSSMSLVVNCAGNFLSGPFFFSTRTIQKILKN